MKNLILILSIAISSSAFAGQIRITSSSSEKKELQPLAQETAGILSDAGLKFQDKGSGISEVELKNFHCDYRHRGAWDRAEILSGVPTNVCRMNSENVQDSRKGRLFRDGRALQWIFQKLENAYPSTVFFGDCAMGYCGTFAKSVVCRVDTNIETYSDGRFSCTFTDGL